MLRVGDVLIVVLSGWLASVIYPKGMLTLPGYILGMVLAVLLCQVLFPAFGMYRAWRGVSFGEEIRAITLAWTTTLVTLTFFAFITKTGPDFSRGWFMIWLVVGWIMLVLGRISLRSALRELRRHGFNQRRVAIVGHPAKAAEVAQRLADEPWAGLVVSAVFPPAPPPASAAADDCPASESVNTTDDFAGLLAFVQDGGADQVWIVVPLRDEHTIHRVQFALRHSTADVRYVPDISGFKLLNQSIDEVAGMPVISLSSSGMDSVDILVKAIEDRLLAVLILALLSPLMIAITLGVKLSSPGPILFRQRRSGIGGETITVLKFRSMVVHAEASGQLTQARHNDPRLTPFGAFLRRTSLDELPQFFNVLTGDMSIVGPRPHALEHNEQYKLLVDRYMARHKIKPGITGWAQINGFRGETDTLEKMKKRVEYDLYYIENWSIWFDLKIIAQTIVRGFLDPNAY